VAKKTRKSWEGKLIYLLVAIGYEVGLENIWCFRTWQRCLVEDSYRVESTAVSYRVDSTAVVKGDGI